MPIADPQKFWADGLPFEAVFISSVDEGGQTYWRDGLSASELNTQDPPAPATVDVVVPRHVWL